MDGGKSKINPPNSHPSNPLNKAATAEATKEPMPVIQTAAEEQTPAEQTESKPTPTAGSGSEFHDVNKVAVVVGAVTIADLVFLTLR